MAKDLVSVYEAQDLPEAELLRQRLEDDGIDAYVEPTASPLDGLTAANQGTHVMIREEDIPRAEPVIAQFVAEQSD